MKQPQEPAGQQTPLSRWLIQRRIDRLYRKMYLGSLEGADDKRAAMLDEIERLKNLIYPPNRSPR